MSNNDTSPNWYAKLHPIGKDERGSELINKRRRVLNLSLFFRIWLAVGIIIIISGVVVFNQLFNYVRPVTQQVIEDTLVDTAKLLSASLQAPLESGKLYDSHYQAMLDTAFQAPTLPKKDSRYASKSQLGELSTWYHHKTHSSFHIYVTDAKGVVIYDSMTGKANAEGADYSRWNDVYLTLQGQYGARTTRTNPSDNSTSVMYVAQPIYASLGDNRRIIGVVSVGKPTKTIIPYLDATRQRMLMTSLIISVIALIMAGLIAWWLKQSMMLVTRYTQSLAQDTKKPYFYLGRELNEMTDTIETMKHRLENRAYVTDYVHTLTHELKSPLTAIRASGELLEASDLDGEDRLMLSQTITEQSIKLQSLIDRLLLLAKIEQPTFKLAMQTLDVDDLLKRLIEGSELQRQRQQVDIEYQIDDGDHDAVGTSGDIDTSDINISDINISDINISETYHIQGDEFWLTQALQNLLDNALYFAHSRVVIGLGLIAQDAGQRQAKHTGQPVGKSNQQLIISILNDGDPIPDYALDKVFDRYFSLSHQYNKPHQATSQQLNQHPSPQVSHQISHQISQGKKGTGLGLTLVKQVIERHGGAVNIANVTSETIVDNVFSTFDHLSHEKVTSGVMVTVRLPLLK